MDHRPGGGHNKVSTAKHNIILTVVSQICCDSVIFLQESRNYWNFFSLMDRKAVTSVERLLRFCVSFFAQDGHFYFF